MSLGDKMGAATSRRRPGEEAGGAAKSSRGDGRVVEGVDLLQLNLEVARLGVEMERRMRDVEAAAYSRFRFQAGTGWATLAQERKREQLARVKNNDKKAGSPQVWAMSGILDTLMKDARMKDGPKQKLQELVQKVSEPLEVEPYVRHCQVKQTFKKDQVIISFRLAGGLEEVEEELLRLMRLDGQELYGPAPRGPGARRVMEEMGQHWRKVQASYPEEEEEGLKAMQTG